MSHCKEIYGIKVKNKLGQRIRLFLQPKKESYFVLKNILGFSPKNIRYYRIALLHKSSGKDMFNSQSLNNERLEFLGDAILDAIVADIVFRRFPDKNEGFLTNTRSKIVKRETLDRIAYELGLNKIITSSAKNTTTKSHILGNALEAFVGAVYLDQGYERTRQFIETKLIGPYIDIDTVAKEEVNFKSKLLEWSQKRKVSLDYNLLDQISDEKNNPVFRSEVLLNNLSAGIGTGYSKKESQQEASRTALMKIKSDKKFYNSVLNKNKEVKKEIETDTDTDSE